MTGLLSRMKEIRRNLGLSEPVSQGCRKIRIGGSKGFPRMNWTI
jgi:hypothetical protein